MADHGNRRVVFNEVLFFILSESEVKQVVSRLASDMKIARKRGYDLEKLLVALKKRGKS